MRLYLYIFIKLTAVILLLSGCNNTDVSTAPNPSSVHANDVTKMVLNNRVYYVAKPTNGYNSEKAYKLILAFHGSRQLAEDMPSMTLLESVSSNYIVVYPQSKVEEWNEGCECNKPYRLGIDDLQFVEDVVNDVKSKHNIIENELYAVGFSQGGLFAQNLMCNSELEFNGIASVASPMSVPLSQTCEITNNTNYLMIHGKNDITLPYKGFVHSNFGLVASETAIDLIAKKNNIDTDVEIEESEFFSKFTYKNEHHLNQLVAIEAGPHSWSFKQFNTSNEVVAFFDLVSNTKLDEHSSLYRVESNDNNATGENEVAAQNKNVQVRSMGLEHEGPAIILLSGFNKNFHSDSAWFSLLQPLIAKTNRVHVIERFGNGFSSQTDQPSYASFAPALDKTLELLNEKEFVFVSFASSNILAHTWQNLPGSNVTAQLKGMVWIDPDILLPHSISLYQDWPVAWYRGVADDLIPHIEAGNWTPRTLDKIINERVEVESLIPSTYAEDMDWSYYDLISQGRADINKQLTRAKEIINYHDDLNIAFATPISTSVPITIIDTDFESADIATADAEYVEGLKKWQQEGTQWSKMISDNTSGQYIPLLNSNHMAVFEHPDAIIEAIKKFN